MTKETNPFKPKVVKPQAQTIISIDKEVKPILSQGQNLTVIDEQSLTIATELLSQANITLKAVTSSHKAEAEPFETPLKEIDLKYSPTEKALKAMISSIRSMVGEYQTEQTNLLKAKEEAIASRIGAGKGKLQVSTAVAQIDNLERPTSSVQASSGSLSFRPKNTLEIVDPTLIPREYLTPNEDSILEALEQGKAVNGCKIKVIQIPINRRA